MARKYQPLETIYCTQYIYDKTILKVEDFQEFATKNQVPLEDVRLEVNFGGDYFGNDLIFKAERPPTEEEEKKHKEQWDKVEKYRREEAENRKKIRRQEEEKLYQKLKKKFEGKK